MKVHNFLRCRHLLPIGLALSLVGACSGDAPTEPVSGALDVVEPTPDAAASDTDAADDADIDAESDADAVFQPDSCHYDCPGGAQCVDGVVTTYGYAPKPCELGPGCELEVYTCPSGLCGVDSAPYGQEVMDASSLCAPMPVDQDASVTDADQDTSDANGPDAQDASGDADACDPAELEGLCCCDADALVDPQCVDGAWTCAQPYSLYGGSECTDTCGPCSLPCNDPKPGYCAMAPTFNEASWPTPVPGSYSISGTVVDPAGAPISGATVLAASEMLALADSTDGTGGYSIDGVPGQPGRVFVSGFINGFMELNAYQDPQATPALLKAIVLPQLPPNGSPLPADTGGTVTLAGGDLVITAPAGIDYDIGQPEELRGARLSEQELPPLELDLSACSDQPLVGFLVNPLRTRLDSGAFEVTAKLGAVPGSAWSIWVVDHQTATLRKEALGVADANGDVVVDPSTPLRHLDLLIYVAD